MKISIDLESVTADHQWEATVAEVIRDEITSAIRAAVRSKVKQFNSAIQAEVKKIAKDALAAVKKERVHEIARRMAENL